MIAKLLKSITFAFALLGAVTLLHAGEKTCAVTNPAGFVITRGTNLSHWLSQDFRWHSREAWLTKNDLEFIAREGFDHVRLPVDEMELWNEDGSRNEAAFKLMREAIDWSREAHLRVILDMHVLRSHHFNAANEGGTNTLFSDPKAQQHLVKLWKDLASVVGDVPVSELAYEIMNEPVADNPEDWNKLVALVSKAIRKTEPNRVLVIGANRWQIPQSVPLLKLPEGDKNIIISFHTYSPMLLTHYTAEWIGLRDYKGPVNYPGVIAKTEGNAYLEKKQNDPADGHFVKQAAEEWNPERIYKEIEPAVIRAKELGLQLYCGEFGCLPTVPREMRLAYYHDIVSVFEKNGIAWANWEYKGDFGIFEWHGAKETLGAPDVRLLDALMQRDGCTKCVKKPACAK
jgi:endoglucanase